MYNAILVTKRRTLTATHMMIFGAHFHVHNRHLLIIKKNKDPLIMDIHNSVMDIHNCIMDIHNLISKIPNSIMIWSIKDIHN